MIVVMAIIFQVTGIIGSSFILRNVVDIMINNANYERLHRKLQAYRVSHVIINDYEIN